MDEKQKSKANEIMKEIARLTAELVKVVEPTDDEREAYTNDVQANPHIWAEEAEWDELKLCEWVLTERS